MMKKRTKTFKIGECCRGGILKAIQTDDYTEVQVLAWGNKKQLDYYVADNKYLFTDYNRKVALLMWLNDQTTSYYADKVMNWIEEAA